VLVTRPGSPGGSIRGRGFVIAASLLLGWILMHHFPDKAVYTAAVVLVPRNCVVAVVGPERGVRYGAGYRWLATLAVRPLLVFWFSHASISFEHWGCARRRRRSSGGSRSPRLWSRPWWRAYGERKPMQIAHAGALIAFFVAAEWAGTRRCSGPSWAAGGAMLLVALLQESHQLVFRDELTGLLGRRAFARAPAEPRTALRARHGRHPTTYKRFNDAHGHAVGDQVLKLVAGRLAKVAGGGIAYRYGGEEFSVLFPDRDAAQALPHLEAGAGRDRALQDGGARRRPSEGPGRHGQPALNGPRSRRSA
jgi:hypothetical protein